MAKPHTGQLSSQPAWSWVTERGLRVATGRVTLACYHELVSHEFPELEDVIPSDDCILLVFKRGAALSARLQATLASPPSAASATSATLHEIAIVYGGDAGPDLVHVASEAGMSETAYINSHAAVEYTVAFLGFQPGFPYLRGLPDVLHAPRRATPRVRVEAGSVGIGGAYTGIYPASGPGGWQIIGRTAAVLFDPQREAPALLMPGDRVRFIPS